MDDEKKSVVEKLSETVKNLVDSASSTAMQALKPTEPSLDPQRVEPAANERVYIPEATDAAATPVPLLVATKKQRRPAPVKANKRVAKAKKTESTKRASKKNATKKLPAKTKGIKKKKSSRSVKTTTKRTSRKRQPL